MMMNVIEHHADVKKWLEARATSSTVYIHDDICLQFQLRVCMTALSSARDVEIQYSVASSRCCSSSCNNARAHTNTAEAKRVCASLAPSFRVYLSQPSNESPRTVKAIWSILFDVAASHESHGSFDLQGNPPSFWFVASRAST